MLILNAGSTIGTPSNGWTNTFEKAVEHAQEWLRMMNNNGIRDVRIVSNTPADGGRWDFVFMHDITGKCATLSAHGIDNLEWYMEQNTFHPRVYWNGSSTANPKIQDFLADGYEIVIRKKGAV